MYHHTGEAAGIIEPLDDRVANYLKALIRQANRRPKELQSRAAEYVREQIFAGERPPHSLRRRFNPTRKKIKNLITRIKIETRYSKIDQENLMKLKEEWEKWNNIHFSPR